VQGGRQQASSARSDLADSVAQAGAPAGDRSVGGRSALVERLAASPLALRYAADGSPETVFGVPVAEARAVFFPVSRTRALPDGYEPADLVNDLGHPLRALVVGEFRTMFAAAERAGAYPEVISGYRSAEYQALLFDRSIQRQLLRGDSIEQAEAEDLAARFVAPPGRSQHQLGTTADLSSWEIG